MIRVLSGILVPRQFSELLRKSTFRLDKCAFERHSKGGLWIKYRKLPRSRTSENKD